MPSCPSITRAGQQCQGYVPPGSTYCTSHDPSRKEQRQKIASKAGRSKPTAEIKNVKATLRKIADDVLSGHVETAKGSVAAQILGVFIRAAELERRLKESEELEARIAGLEKSAGASRSRSGAAAWHR